MSGLFDDTEFKRPITCEHCGRADCICPLNSLGQACPPKLQSPRVRREKRRGKWNTIIAEIHASPGPGSTNLKPLLKSLRTRLGTGGGLSTPNADDNPGPEIVLQGDHKDAVVAHLIALGYKAKPAGG